MYQPVKVWGLFYWVQYQSQDGTTHHATLLTLKDYLRISGDLARYGIRHTSGSFVL